MHKKYKTQLHRFNPRHKAKELEKLLADDIGLFFATLVKIENSHLIPLLLELSNKVFLEAIERLSPHRVYNAIKESPSDTMTDFLQRVETLNNNYAHKLYALMNTDEHNEFLELSQYSEKQAGAYMQKELLCATLNDTILDIKTAVRAFRKNEEQSYIIKLFVKDENNKFLATLHFSDLILFSDKSTLREIMQKLQPHHPLSVHPTTNVDEVVQLFNEFDLSMLAVVDAQGVLQGRILYDDIYELIQKIDTDQVYKLAGVDDEAEEESFASAQKMRLIWLFVNLGTIITASFVIDNFKETIASYIALAALLPLVAALGGNAGMQAMTVTIRRLTLGEVDFSHAWPVLKREVSIVLLNGSIIALSVSMITYLWFSDALLSLVIAIAMFINLVIAGSAGTLIPLLLKKIGIDPAIASSILLTTISDIFGFFIFLFLAKNILM